MSQALPPPEITLGAIEIFLTYAYDGAPPSKTTQAVIDGLRAMPAEFYKSPPFIRTPDGKLALRLGNRHYQHMKLVLEPAPSAPDVWLFRADTHDRHLCPATDHPEYAAFLALREKNQAVADAIDLAWAKAGVPTFKTFLREDLERRKRAASQGGKA
jgi:hypothetical protein